MSEPGHAAEQASTNTVSSASTGAFRMHPVTLRFGGAAEAEFRAAHAVESLPQVRLGLLLGLLLYAVFGVLDLQVAPERTIILWLIRYAIVCPALTACLVFTWSPSFPRHKEPALVAAMGLAVAGIIAIIALTPPPGNDLHYAGLILAVVAYCTLVRPLFFTAVWLASAEFAAYVVVEVLLGATPFSVLLSNLFFLFGGSILALSASYILEKQARRAFGQSKVIEARTSDLVAANEDLAKKNAELAKSRDEIIRSARRTHLVFSALTEALPGTVLDEKYRLEEKIGSGAFGTVYRATHLALNESVAVKVFRPRSGSSQLDSVDRFRLEGISAFRIRHPNAVVALDFGIAGETIPYLVMELLRGRSLAEEMQATGPMPPVLCAEIMEPVCDVLAEAHAQGVVHRDIKPSNIFLHHDRRGQVVKVIDFGTAKLLADSDGGVPDTVTGFLIGTPAYLAPERVEGGEYGGAVDVYAVGVTLYEMLTGRLPFDTPRGDWAIAMLRRTQPAPISATTSSLNEALHTAVMNALARDPQQRPTAEGLRRVLADARGNSPQRPRFPVAEPVG